jgi:broad specificity phosphatase PhoE
MSTVYVITHPDVAIDPAIPVPDWPLSPRGRARMQAALARDWPKRIRTIVSSRERKAIDTAQILADGLALEFTTLADLGENDRSATGYLAREEFEKTADQFFAHPEHSVRGWERAIDAQRRMAGAMDAVLATAPSQGDVAVITHGAVATLFMCALEQMPISRAHDQPTGGGGHYYAFDRARRLLRHGWLAIDGD